MQNITTLDIDQAQPALSVAPLDAVTEAADNLAAARQGYDTAILRALGAGAPLAQVARAAGLSRQAVYDLRNRNQEN